MSETVFPAGDLMKGKRGLVMGVANKNSIAWGIAQQLAAQGAELAFSYQDDALEPVSYTHLTLPTICSV